MNNEKIFASGGVTELKPGMLVLVCDTAGETEWKVSVFSHRKADDDVYPYVTVSGNYEQCIPLEGNEHLVGTTLPIPQKEKPLEWGEKVLVWDDEGDEKTHAMFLEMNRDVYGVITKGSSVKSFWRHCERAPLDAAAENG